MKNFSISKLAETVLRQRKLLNLTQQDLADKAGINRSMLCRLENQDYVPSIDQLTRLANALQFDVTDVFIEYSKPVFHHVVPRNITVYGAGYVGLSVATLRVPQAEYCLGPVSISNDYPRFFKSLAVHFLRREFQYPDAERLVTPPHPFESDFLSVDPDALLQTVPAGDMDKFDRLMGILSDGKYRLPVLVRKYFSCSARLLCFNVDPDFTDSLDGLILLRLKDFPPQTLRSILRGVPAELRDEVFLHFYGTTEP